MIKELEEKESLLRDRKNEVSAKLGLAFKEKETGNLNLLELEKELQNYKAAVRKGRRKLRFLKRNSGTTQRQYWKSRSRSPRF